MIIYTVSHLLIEKYFFMFPKRIQRKSRGGGGSDRPPAPTCSLIRYIHTSDYCDANITKPSYVAQPHPPSQPAPAICPGRLLHPLNTLRPPLQSGRIPTAAAAPHLRSPLSWSLHIKPLLPVHSVHFFLYSSISVFFCFLLKPAVVDLSLLLGCISLGSGALNISQSGLCSVLLSF